MIILVSKWRKSLKQGNVEAFLVGRCLEVPLTLKLTDKLLERIFNMLGMGIIGWIIIGGLAGWIASKIKGTDAEQGIGLNIIVGIVGGLLGGFLLNLFGVDVAGGGLIFSFITCLLGAVILLTIVNAVRGRK